MRVKSEVMKKVCKYDSSMIMMGERLEDKLFALVLFLPDGR